MNNTIWITWFQGWDNAPEISQKCLESWKHYNPDWNIEDNSKSNQIDHFDGNRKNNDISNLSVVTNQQNNFVLFFQNQFQKLILNSFQVR